MATEYSQDRDLEHIVAAVKSGDVDSVRVYLDAGGEPNTLCNQPSKGSSLLSLACSMNSVDLAKLLVSRGANVDHRDVT
jgi:ankyrin repeat protein